MKWKMMNKLIWLKIIYWIKLHIQYRMIHVSEFHLYVREMTIRRIEIENLEREINTNC